jgi:hypothetical protein
MIKVEAAVKEREEKRTHEGRFERQVRNGERSLRQRLLPRYSTFGILCYQIRDKQYVYWVMESECNGEISRARRGHPAAHLRRSPFNQTLSSTYSFRTRRLGFAERGHAAIHSIEPRKYDASTLWHCAEVDRRIGKRTTQQALRKSGVYQCAVWFASPAPDPATVPDRSRTRGERRRQRHVRAAVI